jgi:hypothetical protein
LRREIEVVFQIEWTPTEAIMALAKKRGMPEGDDSPLDYCEPDDASLYLQRPTFAEAVEVAKAKLAEDFFGQVRIERLVRISSRYMKDRWDAEATWHMADGDVLDEANPDSTHEIDLIDDERIVR